MVGVTYVPTARTLSDPTKGARLKHVLEDFLVGYPFSDKEQKHIAFCIKPLFAGRTGKNILVHGPPGVGKSAAVKHLFRELEETNDDITPIYINTWQKNTTFKIIIDICEQLDYKFTHNKKTEELFDILKNMLNKKAVVFCFDEIDKAVDLDFLYMILEQIYRKTIILITNYHEWAINLDERIKSRLVLEFLEFKKYNNSEIKGILAERLKYAFVPNVWTSDALSFAVNKTTEIGDVRTGLYLLRESGNSAEDRSSRNIEVKDVEAAIQKIGIMKPKKPEELKDDEQMILDVVKENSGKKKNLDKINLRLIHQKGRNLLLFQNFHHLKNNSKKTKKSVKTKAQAKTMKARQKVQKAVIPVQVQMEVKAEAVQ